jgi:hypothetical protein
MLNSRRRSSIVTAGRNRRYARDVHQIKTIPAKIGRPPLTDKPLRGKYREQMRTRFDKETYGQRWQVETVFSMIKRNFGDTIRARTYWAQCREMMLLVLTHNIAIILLLRELFYKAGQESFFGDFCFVWWDRGAVISYQSTVIRVSVGGDQPRCRARGGPSPRWPPDQGPG